MIVGASVQEAHDWATTAISMRHVVQEVRAVVLVQAPHTSTSTIGTAHASPHLGESRCTWGGSVVHKVYKQAPPGNSGPKGQQPRATSARVGAVLDAKGVALLGRHEQ